MSGARLALAVAVLAPLCACGSCEQLAGPEGEVARQLRAAEAHPPASGPFVLSRARFDRLLVKPEGEGFVAVCTADAEGTYQGRTRVSYLGLERIAFGRLADGSIGPTKSLLPALAELVGVLEQRREAYNKQDRARLQSLVARGWDDKQTPRAMLEERLRSLSATPLPAPISWTVRIDRERTEVLEEYPPESPGGPPRRLRHTLVREGGAFRFASGLL